MGDNPYADLEAKYANNIAQQNDLLNQSEQINNQQIDENNKFVLDNIEQQRGYAKKDFQKEARGAYQDYQKLVNPYGVQAENIFSNGLGNSGYSETSKLNAYNTYQNRYATAKESTDRLMQDFNNQMTQAGLEANAQKAQFALQKLQTQMSNLWQQLDFDSTLAQNKTNYNQWLESFNYQKEQDRIANELAREQFEYQKQQNALSNYYSSGSNDYYPTIDDIGGNDDGNGNSNDNSELTDEERRILVENGYVGYGPETGTPISEASGTYLLPAYSENDKGNSGKKQQTVVNVGGKTVSSTSDRGWLSWIGDLLNG